ncbi:MAG: Nramp family divalent metal transporter [Gaiellales bacterium]
MPGEARVLAAATASLSGERRGLARLWPLLGPAFVASIAYVDPGNFATNIAAGSRYGYLLLWVILAANLIGMLVQSMSATLGIASGLSLPEVCRRRHARPTVIGLWLIAEVVAMATDLAEFIGAAIALNLLFDLPLLPAALVTAVGTFAILQLQTRGGFRHMEAVITGLLGIIIVGFLVQVILAGPSGVGIAHGLLVPGFSGTESILLAAGILGATVMPHVIYLHSALTKPRAHGRDEEARSRLIRFERIDVVIAMAIAGVVNMSMLIVAAAVFHARGLDHVVDLDEVHRLLGPLLGHGAPVLFALALLASGLSSSSVGTLAGQVIMEGFLGRTIPLTLRRLITMAPALILIALEVNATRALIISQVVLSFGIPFALVPLILASRDRAIMGRFALRRPGLAAAVVVAVLIVALNVFLLARTVAA